MFQELLWLEVGKSLERLLDAEIVQKSIRDREALAD